MRLRPLSILLLLPCAALPPAHSETASLQLTLTKHKPANADWQPRPTRTLAQLPGFEATTPVPTSRWGGWAEAPVDAGTGFFRVHQSASGRWWFLDPTGHRFLHVGMAGVYRGTEKIAAETTARLFPKPGTWATATLNLLRDHHFNALGGWSERAAVADHPAVLPYTVSLSFMASFGRHLGITHVNPGQTGYINEVPPIFHPDFPAWCESYAQKHVTAWREDPMVLGAFSDNELPLRRDLLDRSVQLDPDHPGTRPMQRAAVDWLRARHGPEASLLPADLTDADRIAFLTLACETYFTHVAAALRRHAPHHLYLGSRFHGRVTLQPEVFAVAGRFVDVVSVNYYHAWSADPGRLAMWIEASGRPVLITEFYAKGMDSGMANVNGAGWVVPTQADRGDFYQNYTLSLLEAGTVVGWHWFKFRDNEPFDDVAMLGNQDTNKGIVSWDYQPYLPLLERMQALNAAVYPLTEYFDRPR